jgi:hypothetical protein
VNIRLARIEDWSLTFKIEVDQFVYYRHSENLLLITATSKLNPRQTSQKATIRLTTFEKANTLKWQVASGKWTSPGPISEPVTRDGLVAFKERTEKISTID